MNIRHRKDITIIQWPAPNIAFSKSFVYDENDEFYSNSPAGSRLLLDTLNNPSEQSFDYLHSSPAVNDYIQSASSSASSSWKMRKGGKVDEEEEEEEEEKEKEQTTQESETEFVDLREVAFKVSQLVSNYQLQANDSKSIKPNAIRSYFEENVQFHDKLWMQAETKIVQSIMKTFESTNGKHGVYTIYWKLQARKSESSRKMYFDVLSKGKQESKMSSFASVDDWPDDVVWFRTILDIEHDGVLFPFRACTYNFLVSRKERIVFGWTCANITDAEATKALMTFFTDVVFQFLFLVEEGEEEEKEKEEEEEETQKSSFSLKSKKKRARSKKTLSKKKKLSAWKFVFTRSFSFILQKNEVITDVLEFQSSEKNKLIAEGAFELAVDVRMIHSLLQTTFFRSAFEKVSSSSNSKKPKGHLSSFLQSVLSKSVVATSTSDANALKQKEGIKIRELSARKVWKHLLQLGTFRKQGISLPVYTAFIYKAVTSSSSSFVNSSATTGDEDEQSEKFIKERKMLFEKDVVQKIIAEQLDKADTWNQSETLVKQQSQVFSLYISDVALPEWTSCFLLGLMETGDFETTMVKQFSPSEQGIEERLRSLFLNMFFVNEMNALHSKILEMENAVGSQRHGEHKWNYFLVPVLLCRKPTSAQDPALQDPLLFWQTYGETAFYVMIGRMKDSISETMDYKGNEEMSMISFYPFESSLNTSLTAWEEFMLEPSNEELFPLQHDTFNDSDEDMFDVKSPLQEKKNKDTSSDMHAIHLDLITQALELSFLCLQRNRALISPLGWSTLLAKEEEGNDDENDADEKSTDLVDELLQEEEDTEGNEEDDDDDDDNLMLDEHAFEGEQ